MQKKKVLTILCFTGFICAALFAVVLFSLQGEPPRDTDTINESRYNSNPDISGKVIGSNAGLMSRVRPQILDDVFAEATCVIIGEVIEDDLVVETSLSIGSVYHNIARVRVIETISGEPPTGEIIYYRQLGTPGSDTLQTKVKSGQTYVFIVKYFEEIDQYMATAFEESIFYIDSDNKLTSMSNQLFCARYDGIDIGVFREDAVIIHERISRLN